MQFEPNRGQAGEPVRFLSRGQGYALLLTPAEAVLALRTSSHEIHERGKRTGRGLAQVSGATQTELRIKLLGANPSTRLEGMDELPGTVNYFLAGHPEDWRLSIPTFAKVRYRDVYAGIDLVYYGNQRQLEYDFIVQPRGAPGDILLGFSGYDRLEVNDQGQLVAHIPGGDVRWNKPFAYQQNGIEREPVQVRFDLKAGGRVGFEVGSYDAGRPLIIDPVLVYATYLGGSGLETVWGVAVDPSGNVCVAGDTTSLNFPTVSAYRATPIGSNDVFVTKIRAGGSNLVYSTYLGGTRDDFAGGIAVDSAGNAYVVGTTESTGFPTTANPIRPSNSGFYDAFVSKLGPFGTNLLYSTYLGGENDDSGYAIAADNSGNAYAAGETFSTSTGNPKFPATQGTYQGGNGGGRDAWVAKINTAGSSLTYCTFLGGNSSERANAIAFDSTGNAYVAGEVRDDAAVPPDFPSSNFPMQTPFQATFNPGATDPFLAGNSDGFVTKLNAAGTDLIFSTFLGGGSDEAACGIAVDSSNRVYVVGETTSTNFPVTANSIQPAIADPENTGYPAPDVFVTVFQNSGTSLFYSTYLGGSDYESGFGFYRMGIAVDGFGDVYVTGQTTSLDFPLTGGADQTNAYGSSDGFVTKINPVVPGPAALIYSTLIGGNDNDRGVAIAVDTNGSFHVAGLTASTSLFPVTPGAFRSTNSGGFGDAFVAKYTSPPDLSVAVTPSVEPTVVGSNVTYTIRINNNGRSTFNNVSNFVQFGAYVQLGAITTTRGNYSTNAGMVVFNVGTMTNNASVLQTVSFTNTAAGVTTNTAALTSTETPTLEPNTTNNTAALVSTVRGIADVSIAKSAAPNPVIAGSNLTYTVGVTNKGPWPATSVVVTDALPSAVGFVSAIVGQGSCTTNGAIVTCSLGTLTNGAGVVITLTTLAINPGNVTNVATVTAYELDANLANNSASATATINALADLTLGKSASLNPALTGSNLVYTLLITNRGPSTATSVVLTDPLPPGALYVSASASQGSTGTNAGVFTCNLGSMSNNATATVTLTVRPTIAGSLTNTASIASAASDPVPANNSASVVTTVNPATDLSVSQIAQPTTTLVASNVTFTVTVTNRGPVTASGVTLTDALPLPFTLLSAVPSQGSCTLSGGILTCNLGSLANGTAATVSILTRAGLDGVYSNVASVTANLTELNPANNTSTVSVTANENPNVPVLRLTRANTNVVLSWPTNATNFTLQAKSSLDTNLTWSAVTNVPVVVSNRYQVTNAIAPTNRYHRLFR